MKKEFANLQQHIVFLERMVEQDKQMLKNDKAWLARSRKSLRRLQEKYSK